MPTPKLRVGGGHPLLLPWDPEAPWSRSRMTSHCVRGSEGGKMEVS